MDERWGGVGRRSGERGCDDNDVVDRALAHQNTVSSGMTREQRDGVWEKEGRWRFIEEERDALTWIIY